MDYMSEKTIKMNNDSEYNKIPVVYCSGCLYLGNPKTRFLFDTNINYCPYCGSTDFIKGTIEEWETKFENKYKQGNFLKLKKSWKQIMEEQ